MRSHRIRIHELGQAFSVRAGEPYPQLLKHEVLEPLGMHDTAIALSPDQQARFIPGHTGDHKPAHAWDLDAFAGAGAIRSTASDMLLYVEANLHPEKLKPVGASTPAKTIAAALTQDHELRADFLAGRRLRWLGSLIPPREITGTTARLADTVHTRSSIPRATTARSCSSIPHSAKKAATRTGSASISARGLPANRPSHFEIRLAFSVAC
jgi:CubicO group peptidase (beta-lactamase class C family)